MIRARTSNEPLIEELQVLRQHVARLDRKCRQFQEALREKEEKLDAMSRSTGDHMSMVDRDFNIMWVNKAAEQEFGSDIIGKKCYQIFLRRKRPCEPCNTLETFQDGKVHELYNHRIDKDGETIYCHCTANVALTDREGKPSTVLVTCRDITKSKQAEEELRQSEERYRTIFESANDIMLLTDKKGKILDINQKLKELGQYEREELVGKNLSSLANIMTRKSLAIAIKNFLKIVAGGDVPPFEVELLRENQDPAITEINTRAIKKGDKVVGVLSILRDVTERKQVEERLRQAKEQFQVLVEESPLGVSLIRKDHRYRYVNPKFVQMFGYSLEDFSTRQEWLELVYPDPEYREQVRAVWLGDLKGSNHGEVRARIFTMTCKDGSQKIIHFRPVALGGGEQFMLYEDITEQTQAEEGIKHAAEEWRATFDSITDMVSIHDKDYRIVRVNKAFADAFNMKPKELIGKTCYELVHGTKGPPANCPLKQTFATKKPASGEYFEPRLGIHLDESISPMINENGEVVNSVHVARDITRQKEADEKLIITDRLASIGELSSGIAHELNNPLTSVIGFSQLLMDEDVPDNIREDLGVVCSEAQRAASIVKNLLTFARKHAPVKHPSQINSIIEDVLNLRAYEQRVNNIQVKNRFAPNLPKIMVDYFQMQQVFLNIIINAENAMLEAHGSGRLNITTETVNSSIRVSFADDGPGISEENLGHVFDPFFTTKEVGKGTGLGLSICHGIITAHSGRIYTKSKLGKGATFVVELPIGPKGGALEPDITHGKGIPVSKADNLSESGD